MGGLHDLKSFRRACEANNSSKHCLSWKEESLPIGGGRFYVEGGGAAESALLC